MVGYVSLTQENELLALRLLEEHGRLVRPIVDRHHGRVIKTIGDAFLVEFDSALDAVQCALALQRALHDAERLRPEEAVRIRVGIHVGDVLHREGDVFGDAVNLLARLTPLAEPGGICLSEPVFQQVRNRIDFPCQRVELPPLRHVEFPFTAYRIELPWLAEAGGVPRTPWTDRHRELELLERALTRAMNGQPEAIVLSGEAGIGKSRLADEAARRARDHGFRVLRGSFYGQVAGPYSAWSTGLREFVAEAPTPLLDRVCGSYGGDLAKLVPELGERVGAVAATLPEDPNQGRRRLFDGVAHLLASLSKEAPVLLILDDLQNADDASLHLLEHVVRSVRTERILFVGAYRDTEVDEDARLHQVLVDLGRERVVTAVHLDRLGPEEVRRLVELVYGGPPPDPELASAVFERTGGNPFFVEELVRCIRESCAGVPATPVSSVANIPWPETVRRVLRQRLVRLPPETVRLLGIASVIGPTFPFELLEQVSATGGSLLLDALESALRARVLVEQRVDHGPARYGFADRQTRDLLYRDLSQIRARQYHRQIAAALETAYGPRAHEHAEELALHYLEGDVRDKALEYSLAAARHAAALYARESAIHHYRTAIDLFDEADVARSAAALEELAEQQGHQGEMDEMRRNLDEAARRYESANDRTSAARVLLRVSHIYRWAFYDHASSVERIEHAQKCLEGLPETGQLAALSVELAAEFASQLTHFAEARALYERAIAIAERVGDERQVLMARLNLLALAPPSQHAETYRKVRALLEPAFVSKPDPDLVRGGYDFLSEYASEVEGDGPGAVHLLETAVRWLREHGAVAGAMDISGQNLAADHLQLGHLAEARRLAEETYAYALRNYPTPDAPNLAVLGELARLEGDPAKAREMFDRAAELLVRSASPAFSYWVDGFRLHLEVDQEAYDLAGARAAELVGRMEGKETMATFASIECQVLELAVRAALPRGEVSLAESYLARLREIVAQLDVDTTRAYLDRAEGRLAASQRSFETAVERLRASLARFDRLGRRPEQADTEELLGHTLLESGDADGARAAFDRARALRAEMGLEPHEPTRSVPEGGDRATTEPIDY